jgi:hypothetical protein
VGLPEPAALFVSLERIFVKNQANVHHHHHHAAAMVSLALCILRTV